MDDDDDGSASLSIPNEYIDFDLVYSLHSFAATIEGPANVVKGDGLFLMDDSHSCRWLVRVLKTQEGGIYPRKISKRRLNGWQDLANIVTLMYVNQFISYAQLWNPLFQLASATQTELQGGQVIVGDRLRAGLTSRVESSKSPSPAGRRW